MADKQLIDGKKLVDEITASFLTQAEAVKTLYTNVNNYADTFAKLPSEQKNFFNMVEKSNGALVKEQENFKKLVAEIQKEIEVRKKLEAESVNYSNKEASRKKKQIDDAYKQRDAQIESERQKQVQIQKTFDDAEKANNKLIQSEEKRAEKERKLIDQRDKRLAESIAKQEKLWSRTGSNSSIPGMSFKIADVEKAKRDAEILLANNKKLNDTYLQTKIKLNEVSRAYQNSILNTGSQSKETQKLKREFDDLNKKIGLADKAIGKFSSSNNSLKKLSSSVGNLMSAFGIGTGLYLAVDIAKNIYETTKQIQSLDLALKMVSETQAIYSDNTTFLRDISEKWGIEIKGLTEQYTQFYVNAKDKLSQDEIKTSFEGIAKAGSLMGISIDKQNDAFYAFNQMLSKGTVQAEELKKQLGNALPGAIKAATMAYQELNPKIKVTEQYMLDQMKAGNLISSEMVPAIIRAYQKLYGIETVNNVDTLAAAQNRLSNSWTALVKSMNESETGGISKFFSVILEGLTDFLKLIKKINDGGAIPQKLFESKVTEGSDFITKLIQEEKSKKALILVNGKLVESQKELLYSNNEINKSINDKQIYAKKNADFYNEQQKINAQAISDLRKIAKEEKTISLGFGNYSGSKRGIGALKQIELEKKDLQENAKLYGFYYGQLKAIDDLKNKKSKNKSDKEEDLTKKELDKLNKIKKQEEDNEKNKYNLLLSNLERSKFIINQNLKDEGIAKDEKIKLQKELAFTEIAIATVKYKELLRLSKGNLDKQKEASNEYLNAIESISKVDTVFKKPDLVDDSEIELTINVDSSQVQNLIPELKEIFDRAYGFVDVLGKKYEGSFNELTDSQKIKFKELVSQYTSALESGNKDLADSIKQDLDDIITHAEKIKDYLKTFIDDFASNSSFPTLFSILNNEVEGFGENWKTTFTSLSEVAQEAMAKVFEASNRNFDNERKNLENQKDYALKLAGDSASGKAEIEKQYEKKKKEIAIREAKAKKKQTMFNIILDTIQASVAALPNIPLSLVIAGLGALELATVASQQIPQFWKGTDNAPEGVALTQERGREIITDKQGKVKSLGSDKGSQYTFLKQGDKVLNAQKTKDLLFQNDLQSMLSENNIDFFSNSKLPNFTVNNSSGISKDEYFNGVDRIEKAVEKIGISVNVDETGLHIFGNKNANRERSMNNRQFAKGTINP